MTRRGVAMPTMGGMQFWADLRYRAGWRIQQHVLTGQLRLVDAQGRRVMTGSMGACTEALSAAALPPNPARAVVLLHGLGRTRRSFHRLTRVLEESGHPAIAVGYPSTRRPIEAHADQVLELISALQIESLAFVTHSLGGIVARVALASPNWPAHTKATHLAMLAPPSRGAALARRLDSPLFGSVMGPSARQLAGQPELPHPTVPFAIIAGSQRQGRGRNPFIEGDDDGVVGVEETRLEGASRFVVVESLHALIMNHPDAQQEVLDFLGPAAD